MHQYIEYGNLPEEIAEENAIQDCKNYLDDQFEPMVDWLSNTCKSEEVACICLSFIGIQGFPMRVMIKKYCKFEIEN